MIITRTPFRISFFGGGSDFPDFYNHYPASVVSATIDKYCYVTVRHLPPFFEYQNELVYSDIERVNDLANIRHPLIREAMRWLDMRALRLTYDADLPARTGLGTSSSFAVGLLSAFYALKGKASSKQKLAEEAIYLERELCEESGGIQDQIAAAFGGLNKIGFGLNGFSVCPIRMSEQRKKKLNRSLMLFYTGISRFSFDIQTKLEQSSAKNVHTLSKMVELANQAEQLLLQDDDLNFFGELLNQSWQLKRGLTEHVSTDSVDRYYELAIKAGAIGGKLLGAGGGGFLLFFVPEEKQANVRHALAPLMQVPFAFEENGTELLYNEPEDFEITAE